MSGRLGRASQAHDARVTQSGESIQQFFDDYYSDYEANDGWRRWRALLAEVNAGKIARLLRQCGRKPAASVVELGRGGGSCSLSCPGATSAKATLPTRLSLLRYRPTCTDDLYFRSPNSLPPSGWFTGSRSSASTSA